MYALHRCRPRTLHVLSETPCALFLASCTHVREAQIFHCGSFDLASAASRPSTGFCCSLLTPLENRWGYVSQGLLNPDGLSLPICAVQRIQ